MRMAAGTFLALAVSTLQDLAWIVLLPADMSSTTRVLWRKVIAPGGRIQPSTPVTPGRDEGAAILRSIAWLPDGTALAAMDKWGNAALLDTSGRVLKLSLADSGVVVLKVCKSGVNGSCFRVTCCLFTSVWVHLVHCSVLIV